QPFPPLLIRILSGGALKVQRTALRFFSGIGSLLGSASTRAQLFPGSQPNQYSRFPLNPGIGTGYLPSASATTGGFESIVHLSIPGAYSIGCSSISVYVTSWPVWAAMRPMDVTTLACTPNGTSL